MDLYKYKLVAFTTIIFLILNFTHVLPWYCDYFLLVTKNCPYFYIKWANLFVKFCQAFYNSDIYQTAFINDNHLHCKALGDIGCSYSPKLKKFIYKSLFFDGVRCVRVSKTLKTQIFFALLNTIIKKFNCKIELFRDLITQSKCALGLLTYPSASSPCPFRRKLDKDARCEKQPTD